MRSGTHLSQFLRVFLPTFDENKCECRLVVHRTQHKEYVETVVITPGGGGGVSLQNEKRNKV